MGFFEDLPAPEPPEPRRYVEPEWHRIPREVVPAQLPVTQLVFSSPEIAVVLGGIAVYPTGFTMTVTATRHPQAEPTNATTLIDLLHGRGAGTPEERLRLGVLLSDGRRASYPDGHTPRAPSGGPEASITSRGGGGTSETASAEYFVWPLPEAGDLTLLFLWPVAGLEETSVVVSGDDLRAAAARATPIWPDAVMPAYEPPTGSGWSAYGVQ